MSPQKNDKITRQVQEQHTESENSPWALENPMSILRIENQSVSIATSMNPWQKNANQRRKKEKQGDDSSAIKKDI